MSDRPLDGELREAIFEVELLIETTRVTDGPRNSKERVEQQERHQRVRQLSVIRRALYHALEAIDGGEPGLPDREGVGLDGDGNNRCTSGERF